MDEIIIIVKEKTVEKITQYSVYTKKNEDIFLINKLSCNNAKKW